MSTLLEVRNLKKHYPIRKGLLSKQVGSVKAVDGVDVGAAGGNARRCRRVRLRQIDDGAGDFAPDRADGRRNPV